ncbi:hypothetical protein DFH09DRAFT_1067677 [Mycena vulgaris]|nr:hypothetical protein DFH09DRAFT_1067677 [Mycena vulgaris]
MLPRMQHLAAVANLQQLTLLRLHQRSRVCHGVHGADAAPGGPRPQGKSRARSGLQPILDKYECARTCRVVRRTGPVRGLAPAREVGAAAGPAQAPQLQSAAQRTEKTESHWLSDGEQEWRIEATYQRAWNGFPVAKLSRISWSQIAANRVWHATRARGICHGVPSHGTARLKGGVKQGNQEWRSSEKHRRHLWILLTMDSALRQKSFFWAKIAYTANAAVRPVISTIAPKELHDLLTAEGDSSALARRTIEYQLASYAKYMSSPPRDLDHLPRLVDLAARMLPDAADALDDVPDIILSRHIWNWHAISYPNFRRALVKISSDTGERPSILSHEKFLGDSERLGSEWRRGLVTLGNAADVFPTSTTTNLARTIIRSETLPGCSLLDGQRQLTLDIQPSIAAFRRTFERMSDGLLKNLDWNNIFVAGGIVLGTLLALNAPPGKQQPADQWKSSDIDIYIHGLGPNAANEKIAQLFKTFRANLPPRTPTLVVRNSKTITFYSRYPLRRVQVVLKLVKSPRAVLLNFDLDICAMGWDGSELWMLPRTARALESMSYLYCFPFPSAEPNFCSRIQRLHHELGPGPLFVRAPRNTGTEVFIFPYPPGTGVECLLFRVFKYAKKAIATAARLWTKAVITEVLPSPGRWDELVSHLDLENRHQTSSEPQERSCLTGFSLFMRHVALWEMEQRGEIVIDEKEWASTQYNDSVHSVLAYDDTPSYTWGEAFNIPDFTLEIDRFNLRQITDWLEADRNFPELHNISEDCEEFTSAARVTHGPTVAKVMDRGHDIVMAVLLPANFAAFANRLVTEAQAATGLRVEMILKPAVTSQKHLIVDPESSDKTQGIFLWRIGRELMWQQLDRKIDETFEVLYAFYRANDRTHGGWEDIRLLTHLSKRAIRPTIEDEFAAFARWVGRKPIFVDRFFNGAAALEGIKGQLILCLGAPAGGSAVCTLFLLATPTTIGDRTISSSAPPPTDNTSLRTRLAEIDAQMEQLQKRLDELAAARKPISDALASIVYPILTLPPEITGEIFMHYVAAGAVTAGDASLIELHNSDGGPLLLWSRLRISKRLASAEKLLQCLSCALPDSFPIHYTLGRSPFLKKLTVMGHEVGGIPGSPTPFRAFADAH